MSYQTPILFIVFNRPDATREVFNAIAEAKPKYLYLSCDAPRNLLEEKACSEVKEIISRIDWDCEVKTRFQQENLGCKLNVSTSISWFFEHVDQGIILEDDCLPSPSFFNFVEIMLDKFKDDNRIMQISGNNYLSNDFKINGDYYFSTINDIWGWATWKRAWNHFDLGMAGYEELKNNKTIANYYRNREITNWTLIYLDEAVKPECKIWSPQWVYALIKFQGYTVVPKVNLIQNIGFLEGENVDENLYREYGVIEAENYDFSKISSEKIEAVPNYLADKNRFLKIKKTDVNIFPSIKLKRFLRTYLYRVISQESRKKIKALVGLSNQSK